MQSSDGSEIVDDLAVANSFAVYFPSVFRQHDDMSCRLLPPTFVSLDSVVADIPCILTAIGKLSDKISLTPDDILSYFLKLTADAICVPFFLSLFGLSLFGACLPKAWKTAIVVPLLKKQPFSSVCNCHPISLISSVCKVLEILVSDSVTTHLLSLGLLHSSQHGFRAGCPTLSQFVLASADWFSTFNDPVQTEVVYFARASDVACHRKLLLMLEPYGISGALLKWVGSFMMRSTFRVKVGNF